MNLKKTKGKLNKTTLEQIRKSEEDIRLGRTKKINSVQEILDQLK